jgi:LytR cell envelope-related transcriptional attenuator
MTETHHHPHHRRGAHRTGRSLVHALMPSVLAVAAVAALITSLAVWRGETPSQPSAAAATTTSKAASREALSQPTSTGAASTAPVTTVPASTKAARSTTAAQETGRDVEVVVLNQTSHEGLAGTVADLLRSKGWSVPAVGNFRGTVPATTVYYPPGDEAAAQAAAESLPTAPRIRPTFGNLSTSRLTVVVTDTYPR